jgi:hypothetical protein
VVGDSHFHPESEEKQNKPVNPACPVEFTCDSEAYSTGVDPVKKNINLESFPLFLSFDLSLSLCSLL